MSFFKKLFGSNTQKNTSEIQTKVYSYKDFWDWFKTKEKKFHKIVKSRGNIEQDFFSPLSEQLKRVQQGIYFLTGMDSDDTVELILTPDGNIKNIVFVEELVNTAPTIEGWKFTALKSPTNIEHATIEMGNYKFGTDNIHFYSNNSNYFPDEIDITIVYNDFVYQDKELITNGIYIFLDNYLGELRSITLIDNLRIVSPADAQEELVPISKMQDFLIWREKEFVEKYEADYRISENDAYTLFEAELENGLPLIATMNTTVLDWEAKPSHPYIVRISIDYPASDNGLPDQRSFDQMNNLEDDLILKLENKNGYLNIGRQTGEGLRELYFASKEFRIVSKIVKEIIEKYSLDLKITYEIYKDKYWQTFERFKQSISN